MAWDAQKRVRTLVYRVTAMALLACAAFSPSGYAQFSADYQTNIISGVISNWTGNYFVGSNTFANVLLIQNGGILSNSAGYLGGLTGSSNNNVLVTDQGSVWKNASILYVGNDGSYNSLEINNNGKVISSSGYIGRHSYSNSVCVAGIGSVWTNGGNLTVGSSGSGNSLVISNAGQVMNASGVVGENPGARRNNVLVTGLNSVWSNRTDLFVGRLGAGNRLEIRDGGRVYSGNACLSYEGGSSQSESNSVLVTDSGSLWNSSGSLIVGDHGSGSSLTISNGGRVCNTTGFVGGSFTGPSGGNRVLATGSSSVWSNSGTLYIGKYGSDNSLVINDSGAVYSSEGRIGCYDAMQNSVEVSGLGSIWSNSLDLTVGDYGMGSLIISNGGQVFNQGGYLGGIWYGSNSTVRVVDGGKWWNSFVWVGYQSAGNALIVQQGTVVATNLVVGVCPDVTNNYVQMDSGNIVVTNADGTGVVDVQNGQFILNGGLLVTDNLVITNANGRFIRNGGTLVAANYVLTPEFDADGDGLVNGWEIAFGFDPLGTNEAKADTDGDGMTNLQEQIAGTNPTNSLSVLRILSIAMTNVDICVTWTVIGGKQYYVQTNAVPGNDGFANLSPFITASGFGESITNFTHSGGATNVPALFYRIRVVP